MKRVIDEAPIKVKLGVAVAIVIAVSGAAWRAAITWNSLETRVTILEHIAHYGSTHAAK